MTPPAAESAEPVVRLLADRIGLDPASVGENLIRTGIRNRMKQLGLARLADYERILRGPTDEVQALIEEVVIPESWFFRDERPFAAFREIARAGWLVHPERSPLTVLCLPCAGGEEPYSVVMTLLDLGLPAERFEVVAVDVSERSIVRAARGIYGASSFRGVSETNRARYFDPAEPAGRYRIKAEVRARVRFERGNILAPDLLAGRPGFAVVFCRNLLIYFDDPARVRAAQNLDRLTAADGYLFLGHADRPEATLLARFAPHGDPGCFLYRRLDRSLPSASAGVVSAPSGRPPMVVVPPLCRSPESGRKTAPAVTPAAASKPVARPEASEVRTRARASRTEGQAPDAGVEPLRRAAELADRGQYDEAAEVVRQHLGRGPLDAPAHFLLGMIRQAAGDRAAAEAELFKAAYLDPDHDEALLALALLARRRGDVAAEATLRRRAERARARKGRT